MCYDKYEHTFGLPDGRIIRGVLYGTYYSQTYEQPSEFVEKEEDCLVLTWEDGTELTDAEYEAELYFEDSDYRCQVQEYAIDIIYDFGHFEYGDPIDLDYEPDPEYIPIAKLFGHGYYLQ